MGSRRLLHSVECHTVYYFVFFSSVLAMFEFTASRGPLELRSRHKEEVGIQSPESEICCHTFRADREIAERAEPI